MKCISGSIVVGADIEPSFLALGPFHLALGMNNRFRKDVCTYMCLIDITDHVTDGQAEAERLIT